MVGTRGGIRTEIIELRKLLLDLVLHPMSFWRRWLRESNGDGGQRALGVPLPVGQGAPDPADGLEPVSAPLRRPARRCLSTSCRAPENGLQPNVLGNRPSDADQRRGPLRASEVQGSSLDDGRFLRPTSAALSKVRAGRYQPERGGRSRLRRSHNSAPAINLRNRREAPREATFATTRGRWGAGPCLRRPTRTLRRHSDGGRDDGPGRRGPCIRLLTLRPSARGWAKRM